MAHKLKEFDFSAPSTLTTTDKAVYPWEDWFDGDIWQLTYGEDFHGHPLMMERIIRTRATGRQAKVKLRHVPMGDDLWGIIIIQRTDIQGPNELRKIARKEKAAATRAAKAPEVKAPVNGKTVNGKAALTHARRVVRRQPTKV